MSEQGILVVISGFSGAGKGTLMKQLLKDYPDQYALSVSATTRQPRPGEVDGKDYFFVDEPKFLNMIEKQELLEHACYVGNYYGTPKAYVMDQLKAGRNVLLEIEIQGAMNIKKIFPNTRLVFLSAPSAEILYNRLSGRGTESAEVIAKRLSRACDEAIGIEEYDYFLINDTIENVTDHFHSIIENERMGKADLNAAYSVANQIDFINRIREELKAFSKGE